MDLDN